MLQGLEEILGDLPKSTQMAYQKVATDFGKTGKSNRLDFLPKLKWKHFFVVAKDFLRHSEKMELLDKAREIPTAP